MPNEELILCSAIAHFGNESQIHMAIEEMSELTKALCKNFRNRDNSEKIAEEIADVQITLKQLIIMFEIQDEVYDWKLHKLLRLDNALRMGDGF